MYPQAHVPSRLHLLLRQLNGPFRTNGAIKIYLSDIYLYRRVLLAYLDTRVYISDDATLRPHTTETIRRPKKKNVRHYFTLYNSNKQLNCSYVHKSKNYNVSFPLILSAIVSSPKPGAVTTRIRMQICG